MHEKIVTRYRNIFNIRELTLGNRIVQQNVPRKNFGIGGLDKRRLGWETLNNLNRENRSRHDVFPMDLLVGLAHVSGTGTCKKN